MFVGILIYQCDAFITTTPQYSSCNASWDPKGQRQHRGRITVMVQDTVIVLF